MTKATTFPFYGTIFIVSLLLLVNSCDTPSGPDFKITQSVDAPVLLSKKFTFLGGANSLVDTTSGDFDSLFVTDSEGLVSLSLDEKFDFDELEDVVPTVDINPRNISSTIDTIEFTNFQSGSGDAGAANFEQFTGISSPPPGSFLPGGQSPPVTIELETGNLVRATVLNGKVVLQLTNDLGFDINELTLQLISNNNDVGNPIQFLNFEHDSTSTKSLTFALGTELETPLKAEIEISWSDQNLQDEGNELVVNEVRGEDLKLSSVTGVLEEQNFTNRDSAEVNTDNFEFTEDGDFIIIRSGELLIDNIINDVDLGLEEVEISSPEIFLSGADMPLPGDTLVANFSIPRNADGNISEQIDLSGTSILSADNNITFNVRAVTEITTDKADSIRTVRFTDTMSLDVSIRDLVIDAVQGLVKPRTELLNNDDSTNGIGLLDVLNLEEAEQAEIDGIENISEQTEDITFLNPSLTLEFNSNIGLPNTIFGALLGIDEQGNRQFLSGINDSEFQVQPSDTVGGFLVDDQVIGNNNLIKFDVPPSLNGEETGSVTFTSDKTTIVDFVSNLPNDIRFVGKTFVNEDEEIGRLSTPVTFDLDLNLNIPLNLATENNPAVIEDTTELESAFDGLPKAGDNTQIVDAQLNILYENGLPLDTDLVIEFLDIVGADTLMLFELPAVPEDNLTISAADVDDISRFVKAKLMRIEGSLLTNNKDGVKIRKDDFLTLDITASLSFESTVD